MHLSETSECTSGDAEGILNIYRANVKGAVLRWHSQLEFEELN